MDICFITHDIAHIGGQERVLTLVANMLAESGINVTILITSKKREDIKNIYPLNPHIQIVRDSKIARGKYSDIPYKLVRLWNKKVCRIKNLKLLERIYFPVMERKRYETFFKKNKYDVIIGLTPRPAAMLAFIDVKGKKVAWLHSTYERYFMKKNDFQWHQELLYKEVFPMLDDVIVLTDFDKKVYGEQFNINPIRIYNPVSFETDDLSKLNSKKVLFVGRLHYDVKGLDYLIDVISKLKEKTKDAKFVIVGDGEGKEEFLKGIRENDLDDMIELVGSSSDVQKYYYDAEICILTSRVEGFGLVIIEAFESGVPVVAFENAGPSELIEDGRSGYLIPKFDTDLFASKIYELLMDDTLRKTMGENAKKKAIEFHRKTILNEWKRFLAGEVGEI